MDLRDVIQAYVPENAQEAADRTVMLDALARFDDCLLRSNRLAHFTASSWIVNPARTHVLMIWHNIYRHWAWTGGHADGESDLLQVALREAREETGLTHVHPVTWELYSLETLTVKPHIKRGSFVPAHLHMNLTWLLEADDTQTLCINPEENSGVKWVPIPGVSEASGEEELIPVYAKLNERLGRFDV